MIPPPPLIGDGQGKYRVHISTLGKKLADALGVPFISLDTYFWLPGWKQSTNDEMREKITKAFAEATDGWVVDGNYTRRIGTIVEETSTDVIWLDPPLALSLPRIIWRTFLRLSWIARMSRIGLGVGSDADGRKMRRLGGWGRDLEIWFAEVQRMVKQG
ncbi:hypothetical protein R3P38DRAFT_3336059 [Favolaschia claudopus]|uniref:Uncharacterized protein n=1 Tax=Favolaschia claudopus TaxID=2862362 RepID=A0AAV9Z681_9AGAR